MKEAKKSPVLLSQPEKKPQPEKVFIKDRFRHHRPF